MTQADGAPRVSVVVASRGRPEDLLLCLTGLMQLDYPAFEIVLVSDAEGMEAAKSLPEFAQIKTVPFEEANLSAARNAGIARSAGEIIAFIDDDAVPEPTWLTHLSAGFADPQVACVGGYVIGRNGISYQWKARALDHWGQATPLELDDRNITVLTPKPGRAIKTEGTNMALRRSVLGKIGGFDPAYRFYLDETDINMRLALHGMASAIAPLAQVHHGYKASPSRRADRAPKDLFEIAASSAVFSRKYLHDSEQSAYHADARKAQRQRVLRDMVSGQLEPGAVRHLMRSFDAGWSEGAQRPLTPPPALPKATEEFRGFQSRFQSGHQIVTGSWRSRHKLRSEAAEAVKHGQRRSLLLLSFTLKPHKTTFTKEGVWVQKGGLFGRSDRGKSGYRGLSREKRLNFEADRIAQVRGLTFEKA